MADRISPTSFEQVGMVSQIEEDLAGYSDKAYSNKSLTLSHKHVKGEDLEWTGVMTTMQFQVCGIRTSIVLDDIDEAWQEIDELLRH